MRSSFSNILRFTGTFGLLLLVASGCSFFLPPNSLDSNNSQGLLNTLLLSDSGATGTSSYTVGGTIAGLSGSGLTLLDSESGTTVSVSGSSFAISGYTDGAAYDFSVATQPTGPYQTCTVSNNTGSISGGSVSDLVITCTTNSYTVGGTIAGLSGSGLVIQNNGGDDLSIAGNGSFTFATSVASGNTYSVTVLTQPSTPAQTCGVSGSTGTIAGGNLTSVTVNCSTSTYTVGGTVSGLSGSGLVLQNNGGDNLSISANGSFSFATSLADLSAYSVTVSTQPSSPSQTCAVSSGSGTIASANVTGVSVTCTTNTYTIGGTVSGLSGSGLVLQNNSGDDLNVSGGSFTFSTSIASGNTYSVTVLTQPSSPTQTCTVSGASGSVVSSNVTSVTVNCTTNTYTIGGTVTGLSGSGLILQNNGGDNLSISANGSFAFATSVASGNTYSVTVQTQPSSLSQACTVSSGSGTVLAANVTSVSISCTTNTYTVGGTVSGLAGSGLVLQNNSGDDLAIAANGSFTFSTSITSGNTYSVTVLTQPSSLSQTCAVTSSSGTVTSANITSVAIACATTQFTVSVTVGEMLGTGLVLQNNGADDQTINADGSYAFTAQDDGTTYSVSILTQPSGPSQTCLAYNTSGTFAGSNVTDVTVSCVDPSSDFTDLGMWLRADSLSSTHGTNITSWTDYSGNGKSPVGTSATNPVYHTDVLNGLPALYFGTAANLSLNTNCLDSTGDGITIIAVVSSDNASGNPRFFFNQGGHNGSGSYYNYGLTYTSGNGEFYVSDGFVSYSLSKSPGEFSLVTSTIYFDNGTGTTGQSHVYVDGSLVGSDTDGNGIQVTNDPGGACSLTWGGGGPGPQTIGGQAKQAGYSGRSLNGYIAELLWYGQHMSTADRERLECMLKTKYDLTGVANGTCP